MGDGNPLAHIWVCKVYVELDAMSAIPASDGLAGMKNCVR